jgi:hypothetical protein
MQFALDNFSFDSFTLWTQISWYTFGYSEYLHQFLSYKSNIGMLSSKPKRLNPDDTCNGEFWPAIQAFKEYDLWKPF